MKNTIAGTIKFGKGQLCFQKLGSGSKKMLCFHGYGQGKEYFEPLIQALPEYSLYSFDLFFHGQSVWDEGDTPLTKEVWQEFFLVFLEKEGVEKFSVCGFSMGAKFALACVEAFPQKVEKITLMAPDGIKPPFLYSMVTNIGLFRRIFKIQIDHPSVFFALAEVMEKLGFMDKSVVRFAKKQMMDPENRSRVYHTWVVFRKLKFNLKALAKIMNIEGIELDIYLGSHDKMITRKSMLQLVRHTDHYRLHMINSAHSSLIFNTAKFIRNKDDQS